MKTYLSLSRFSRCGAILIMFVLASSAVAEEGATVKGKVRFNPDRAKSWDGHSLEIPFAAIKARLFEKMELPPIPFPEEWAKMTMEQRQKWATDFESSPAGLKLIEEHEARLKQQKEFEVKIESNGNFVVYDVPPGIYGLQGAIDQKVAETIYRFEIFGQIEVLKEVDELALAPLQVEITPFIQTGAKAPPIMVDTLGGKGKLTLDKFADQWVFVSFWVSDSPSAVYQEGIQKMFADLKDKHPLRLLLICVDENEKVALKFVQEKQLKLGNHGFTRGLDHRTTFDYGIRTIPSFWLIAPDRTISMTQSDFARAFQVSQDLGEIVSNRIDGKDLPTPAVPEKEKQKEGSEAKAKAEAAEATP